MKGKKKKVLLLCYHIHGILDELDVIQTNMSMHKTLRTVLDPRPTCERTARVLEEHNSHKEPRHVRHSIPNQPDPPPQGHQQEPQRRRGGRAGGCSVLDRQSG